MKRLFLSLCLLTAVLCREYKVYKQLDCNGNDIRQEHTGDIEELKSICDNTEGCVGFNTHGWLKKACPNLELQFSVDTYLDSSIYIPTGEEPEILLWPMPSEYRSGDKVMTIDPIKLRFNINIESEELAEATRRFKSTIFTHHILQSPADSLTEVNIEIVHEHAEFVISKDESYSLVVPDVASSPILIKADNIYGAYHALNSLMFLIQFHSESASYIIKHAPYEIVDQPNLHYRSLMIDSARHFLPIRMIKQMIDAMSWVKLNVLHWHLVDDQSFPVQMESVPGMWDGSFSLEERYTKYDIEDVVTYARSRGVHVIPELDVPGHSQSWCVGAPDICPSPTCLNPLDPSKELTFQTIDKLFEDTVGEESGLFPGEYLHIGGDEVDTDCWNTVEHVRAWMAARNFTANDAYGYFINRVDELVKKHHRETIAWEEVWIHHRETIAKDMIIQIWLGDGERLKDVVHDGFRAIVSNYKHWYLPQLWETWDYYYTNDIYRDVPKEEQHLVFGGEVCMWGETVDASDFERTIMPRAIAAAERMWTQTELLDLEKARIRFPYIRCEFNRRGIAAAPAFGKGRDAPAGPGSCMKQ